MKNTKHLSKRALALLLALVMCLSLVQLTAFADEGEGGSDSDVEIVDVTAPGDDANIDGDNGDDDAIIDGGNGDDDTTTTTTTDGNGGDDTDTTEPEANTPSYATVDELNAAFEAYGKTDDVDGGIAALENVLKVFEALSPEDQEAMAEYKAGAAAQMETLLAAKEAEENDDGDENQNVDPDIQTLASRTVYKGKVTIYGTTDEYNKESEAFTGPTYRNKVTITLPDRTGSSYNNVEFTVPQVSDYFTVKSGWKLKSIMGDGNHGGELSPGGTFLLSMSGGGLVYTFTRDTKTFTLTYDANGGSGAPAAEEKTLTGNSATFNISSTEPTRQGYTFKGWAENKTASSPQYTHNGANSTAKTIAISQNKTLYAVWQPNATKVTLTYNGNGNTGGTAPASQTVDKGTDVTISGKGTLERDSYEFLGWNTDPNATTADWAANDKMRLNENTTLYAVWKEKGPTDNGNGISITKTRVSINDDPNQTTAAKGDEIKWEIKVTNNSNVTKTVKLTEKLSRAYFEGDEEVTLAPAGQDGSSKTVTAKYTVNKKMDKGTIVNTVAASTGGTGEKENPTATDEGTPISADYKVEWYDAATGELIPTANKTPNPDTRDGSGTVSVTEEDKTVTGYTFAENDNRNVMEAEVKADDSTVLKLYFTKNPELEYENDTFNVQAAFKGLENGRSDIPANYELRYTVTNNQYPEWSASGVLKPSDSNCTQTENGSPAYLWTNVPVSVPKGCGNCVVTFTEVNAGVAGYVCGFSGSNPNGALTEAKKVAYTNTGNEPNSVTYNWDRTKAVHHQMNVFTAYAIPQVAVHTYFDKLENGVPVTENGKQTKTEAAVWSGSKAWSAVTRESTYNSVKYIRVVQPASDAKITLATVPLQHKYVRAITVTWLREDGTQVDQVTIPNGSDSYKSKYPANPSTTGKWGDPDTDGDGNIIIQWEEPQTPPQPTEYTVTVKYQDEDGNELKTSETVTTTDGGKYDVTDKKDTAIEGYTFKEVQENKALTGTVTDNDTVIVLVYTKDAEEPGPGPGTEPEEKNATYTVVHEYYTTDRQTDVTTPTGSTSKTFSGEVGAVISAGDIEKITRYGDYDYDFTSASESITLTADGGQQIVLRYDRYVGSTGGGGGNDGPNDPVDPPRQPDDGDDTDITDPDVPKTEPEEPPVDVPEEDPPLVDVPEEPTPEEPAPEEPVVELPDEQPPLVDLPDEQPPLVNLPDEQPPLTVWPIDPEWTFVPDEQPPLVELPEEQPPLVDIPAVEVPEETVPLADAPQTGDISLAWHVVAALSACGLAVLSLKKRDEE